MCDSDPCESVQVLIGQGSHPQKVKVFGPGVERTGLKANEPTHFTVDCTDAGEGKGRLGCCGGIRTTGHARQEIMYCVMLVFLVSWKNLGKQNIAMNCDVICYIN